ncbi:MAG: hypothetical protein V4568_19545 [Pseudomonadota bacterium]
MKPLSQPLFDVFALSLPRGHGFGNCPPKFAWASNDELACGVITQDVRHHRFGILVMRRREDYVWTVICKQDGFGEFEEAYTAMQSSMKEGAPPEPIPANSVRRTQLWDVDSRKPCTLFKLLTQKTHRVAGWMLNQLYLALPSPDKNWVSDFQTSNFHTRMWEVQLLACFREQGMLVTQPQRSPDFYIENLNGDEAWIEAVTANPTARYDHVNAEPIVPPKDLHERVLGAAAVRFAKTLRSKLQRNYHLLPHVVGKPFALAIADFHAPSSMVWSREALISYLYGIYSEAVDVNGRQVITGRKVSHLFGESQFPSGLFRRDESTHVSAVIFTNACSIAKFNRVGISAGALVNDFRYIRVGQFFDRTPGALRGIPFSMDITSDQYRSLWPQNYEPWSAELEVFHNPIAQYPLSRSLLPEATHWFEVDDEIVCASHYEVSILWSKTQVQPSSDNFDE